MKLYYKTGACSLTVRIILNELGLPFEAEEVDFKTKKTQQGDDYLKINPKGSVPALKMNDHEILTENIAIIQYLAEANHNTNLLPPTDHPNRPRVLEWLSFLCSDLHKSCSPIFNPALPDELKATIFRPILKNKLAYIEQHLSKNEYLVGHTFTLPDAYLFVILRWMPSLQINLQDYPKVSKFFEKLQQHPSIAKSLAQEAK